ncbi:Protein transport protein Sec24B [Hypsibius exemplaris]|uniref:Protein transport protein Sec24B n=1 Tax=Hypsibius exemplaris TaxID=2072580 RepID=A0A1W0XBG2_HYPEX|nr:Protein transport protein Sec24B [Hypsibius exemplaris]
MMPNNAGNGPQNGLQNGGGGGNLVNSFQKLNVTPNAAANSSPALPTFRPPQTGNLLNGNQPAGSVRATMPAMPVMPRMPVFSATAAANNGPLHSSASQPLIHPSFAPPAVPVYARPTGTGPGSVMGSSNSQPNLLGQQASVGQSANQASSLYGNQPEVQYINQAAASHVNPTPTQSINQAPAHVANRSTSSSSPAAIGMASQGYQQQQPASNGYISHSSGQMSSQLPYQQAYPASQQSAGTAGQQPSVQQYPTSYAPSQPMTTTPTQFAGSASAFPTPPSTYTTPYQNVPLNAPQSLAQTSQPLPQSLQPGQQPAATSYNTPYQGPGFALQNAGAYSAPASPYYAQQAPQSGLPTPGPYAQQQLQQQPQSMGNQYAPQVHSYQSTAPNGAVQNFTMPNASGYGGPSGLGGGSQLGQNQQSQHHAIGGRLVNLLQSRRILPTDGVEVPTPEARHAFNDVNCSPDIFRCTMNLIPNTKSLLEKSRLPLAILIHPYRDLSNLQVLSVNTIVRCRSCRSYINPFVTFIDQYKWRCNLCDRSNDLPQEFFHDPITRTVGDPSRRPEIRSATIEYIAPSEYALRPPQPAIYVFLLDVCFNAVEVRYLDAFRERLLAVLDRLPGDARTQVAFIAYDSSLHFFQLDNNDWKMLTVADIDDVFIPSTEGILVRLHESMDAVRDLIARLPEIFKGQRDTHSCMGAAIQIAHRLLLPTGGRITVMQTCLPTLGPGALKAREDPNLRAAREVKFLEPATDFYKTLALECSSNQVAVDLFLLAGQYADLTTISGIARYSGGVIHYYPTFNSVSNPVQLGRFENDFTRYLTRKIGFESVMRVRCTNGMSLTNFHGNFFVRSIDLLSLPNINPDSGFAVQIKMDETLTHPGSVCFQAALLYTSSKGERRIRVHTLSVPVSDNLNDIFASADQQAIACIVGKIAAERAFTHPLGDVRDGIVLSCEDALRAYTQIVRPQAGQLLAPHSLRLLPLFTHALLNCTGLRTGVSTTLDQRTYSLLQLKAAPLIEEMMTIYPRLYAVHNIQHAQENESGGLILDQLHLSYENIERGGVYLLEGPFQMILYVTEAVSREFCQDVLGVSGYDRIQDRSTGLPVLETEASEKLRAFIGERYRERPLHPILEITKETGKEKLMFIQYLYDDRSESMQQSYYEFLSNLFQKRVSFFLTTNKLGTPKRHTFQGSLFLVLSTRQELVFARCSFRCVLSELSVSADNLPSIGKVFSVAPLFLPSLRT